MLISIPTGTSTIFGVFQDISFSSGFTAPLPFGNWDKNSHNEVFLANAIKEPGA
jgi:hypothetical protein